LHKPGLYIDMITLFNSINGLGGWFLCGIIAGIGFVMTIIVAIKLYDKYSDRHSSKKEEKEKKLRQLRLEGIRNIIIMPKDLYSWILNTSGNTSNFQQRLIELRRDYWKRDIVIPFLPIEICQFDNDSLIKIEGKIIFKGDLCKESQTDSLEELSQVLIGKIEEHFKSQISKGEIEG